MANIGYVRVSTVEQNNERQKVALSKHNIDRWFEEIASAKDTNRPRLQEMLLYVREGDSIFVHDFSRLARSTKDLLEITQYLKIKGVYLKSNKEDFDTSTPSGKLMLTMLSAIYEFERENLLERQREGIELAKKRGAYKGRKKIKYPSNWETVMKRYFQREINASAAINELKLKRNTFYRLLNEYKKNRKTNDDSQGNGQGVENISGDGSSQVDYRNFEGR